jgi:2-C-methyl-D-erythritol 4-phosphate cytidylyltransferase
MKIAAAVLAAGRGERFGADKTEVILGARPVWRWALDAYLAHPEIDQVILVTSAGKVDHLRSTVDPRVTVVAGGSTRQESSHCALMASNEADFLLVHDAARPFITRELISKTIEAVKRTGAAAAGVPVRDTVKQVDANGIRTLDRSSLVAMQTPQAGSTSLLRSAHEAASREYTDEMAMLEAIGVHPEIVPGDNNNFKITTQEDLLRAQALAGGRFGQPAGPHLRPAFPRVEHELMQCEVLSAHAASTLTQG